MIQYIISVLALILLFCIIFWLVGIVETVDEYRVMSLRTFYRLMKDNNVFDVDMTIGIGYYNDDGYREWVMPHWNWYPVFAAIFIGDAFHKDII